jgi:hypothetical protein
MFRMPALDPDISVDSAEARETGLSINYLS